MRNTLQILLEKPVYVHAYLRVRFGKVEVSIEEDYLEGKF